MFVHGIWAVRHSLSLSLSTIYYELLTILTLYEQDVCKFIVICKDGYGHRNLFKETMIMLIMQEDGLALCHIINTLMVSYKQNFTCLQIISEWIIAYCGETSVHTIPTLVLQLPALATFPLQVRISL